ncbi:MAG: coenzyme F420-0:L-glutamate ligase [Dehalococcoidia bacterium]|jgi:coenzyme F420-0:L-glutamate ligase/coenzyme F420-1:gamma-L-glutamate ligase|nr:coenzyme F420-0:L-glutamate ligase [Dehalococcoidia bacterium]
MTSSTVPPPEFRVIAVTGIPLVEAGDDVAGQIIDAAAAQGTPLEDGDAIAVTQRIVSKAEGRVVPLDSFEPSPFARDFADRMEKDARLVEAVLQESTRVVRQVGGVLITQTRHGFICANAGIDGSNVGGLDVISLLPVDPDASCRGIREAVHERLGVEVAVLMTDTFGRPWREGHTNIAIGVAGFEPMRSYVGLPDMDGRELTVTTICVADELAATSEMVMGKLDAVPAAIIRGFEYARGEGSSAELVRDREHDLFL